MTTTISALFDDYPTASQAVRDLEAADLPSDNISIVANNADDWYGRDADKHPTVDRDRDGVDDRVEGAEAGAGVGAAVGGVVGLLTGLGLLAIPGIGPVVAAGWLASTAAVAAVGAAGGGLIGALTQSGVSEKDAHVYAEGVRRGGSLVTARVPEADRGTYETVLNRSAVRLQEREAAYRDSGWTRYDAATSPYSATEVQRERERYQNRVG